MDEYTSRMIIVAVVEVIVDVVTVMIVIVRFYVKKKINIRSILLSQEERERLLAGGEVATGGRGKGSKGAAIVQQ